MTPAQLNVALASFDHIMDGARYHVLLYLRGGPQIIGAIWKPRDDGMVSIDVAGDDGGEERAFVVVSDIAAIRLLNDPL